MLGRSLKTLLGHLGTLRGFFPLSTTGIALLVFLCHLCFVAAHEKLTNQRTLDTSRDISRQQTFNAIYQILRNGGAHQQVIESIGNSASAFASAPRDVALYPAPDIFKAEARGSLDTPRMSVQCWPAARRAWSRTASNYAICSPSPFVPSAWSAMA
jgi:hypothetical protein